MSCARVVRGEGGGEGLDEKVNVTWKLVRVEEEEEEGFATWGLGFRV